MGFRASLFACSIVVVACGGSLSTSGPSPYDPNGGSFARDDAAAVLAKVEERYATAKTYADEGTFRIVYRHMDGREKHRLTGRFRTRWRAPARLAFSMDEDATDVHPARAVRVSFAEDFDRRSVAESLAKLHGASNGISGVVPLWLVEGMRPMQRYALRGRTPCGDGECHVLETIRDATDKTTLLVDTRTFALHRLFRHAQIAPKAADPEVPARARERSRGHEVDPFVTDEDIVFDARFDGPIDEAELATDPSTASSSPDRPGR